MKGADVTPGPASRPAVAAALLAAALGVFAFGFLWSAWLADDAFITFRSLDHFVHGRGLRWNVAERVQAFTNPLWLFALAPAYALTGQLFWTVMAASFLATAAALGVLIRTAASLRAAAFGVLLLCGSKAFLEYSTSGLENPLLHAALLATTAAFLSSKLSLGDPAIRAGRVALGTSIAFLTRPDALVFTGVLCIAAWLAAPTLRTTGRMLLGWLPALLWEAFSVIYFGTWLPNTAIAKLGGALPADEVHRQGLAYLQNSAAWDPLTLVIIGAAVLCALVRPVGARSSDGEGEHGRGLERVVALALLLHLAYVVRVGGDFMSGRFLSGPVAVAVLLLCRRDPGRRLFALAAVVLAATCALHPRSPWGPRPGALAFEKATDERGISDERAVYYAFTGLMSPGHPAWGRYADGAPYPPGALATERFEAGETVQRHAAVGLTGYFSPPELYIIDVFGLADPLLARLPLTNAEGQPIFRHKRMPNGSFWRIGHLRRGLPPGYVQSLHRDDNSLVDPALARFYGAVRMLTRAPIWSLERWRVIADFQLGRYDDDLAQWRRAQSPKDPR